MENKQKVLSDDEVYPSFCIPNGGSKEIRGNSNLFVYIYIYIQCVLDTIKYMQLQDFFLIKL